MSAVLPIDPELHSQQIRSAKVTACTQVPAASDVTTMRPLLLCLAVLPFLMVPASHLLANRATATGLFHYELPYYVANGRSVFERGNGLAYPNPYDPEANAPVIYFHWLPWLLGAVTALVGADPGTLMTGFTVVAALMFAETTRRLVAACVPLRAASLMFLLAMWGGGLLAVTGSLTGLLSSQAGVDPLRLDPGNGLWFLNWGRNVLFPTEALYHAIATCCWLAEVRRQRRVAFICVVLLSTTHPWSGLELLLTLNLWRWIQFLRTRSATEFRHAAWVGVLLLCLLGYYRVWLPSFPQHAALQSVWELDWSLAWSSAVPAWGAVAIAAGIRFRKDPNVLRDPTVPFLLCALLVAVGLSLHDRFMKPIQPLHFTRGYVWMPLFLIGAPVLWTAIQRVWDRSIRARTLVCGLMLLLISDNFVFAAVHSVRQLKSEDGFHLDVHDRALLRELDRQHFGSVVLLDSVKMNYLLPTYAAVRPWLGHQFNTPNYTSRRDRMKRCFAENTVMSSQIPAGVDVLAVKRSRDCSDLVVSGDWLDFPSHNAVWSLWIRAPGLR